MPTKSPGALWSSHRLARAAFVMWVTAAFFEEMVFRSFALDRLVRLLGEGRVMIFAASGLNALGFGLLQAYQGPMGIIQTGVIGFIFSLFWFATGRNLWALIAAHGLINSWSMWRLYSYGRPRPRADAGRWLSVRLAPPSGFAGCLGHDSLPC